MTTTLSTSGTLADLVREHAAKGRSSRRLLDAAETLDTQGFPDASHEQWRYFPTAPVLGQIWHSAMEARIDSGTPSIPAGEAAHVRIVNGFLEQPAGLPAGVTLHVVDAAEHLPEQVGSTYTDAAHPFAALNLLLTPGVIVVTVDAGTVVEDVIHFDFHSVAGEGATLVTPRVLLLAGTNSRVTLLETWSGRGALLVVPVVELISEPGAIVDHVRLVLESDETTHIANHRALLARDAVLRSFLISTGGGRVRNELNAVLDGTGADVSMDGLWMLGGTQRADQHTTIDHAKPHTTSRELFKGIVGDRSTGIFEGLVVVRPDAQKISSEQTNNNLLLSSSAVADSKPQLEIYADDVRCAHGSTIGQLEESHLFYLQSRGIALDDARRILTLAFAGEMIDRLPIPALREPLREMLASRVPQPEESR